MKMKKWLSVLLIAVLCVSFTAAFGEETEATAPVTAEAIRNTIKEFRQTALKSECLSSVPSEDTENDTSWILEYPFGTLNASTEKLAEDSVIYDLRITAQDQLVLPGMTVGMTVGNLLNNYRNDNAGLAGDYYGSLIYLDGDPETGFSAAFLSREGQRNAYIHYQTVTPNGKMFDNASIFCFIGGGVIDAIELYAADSAFSPEDAVNAYAIMAAYADKDEYVAVTNDYNDGSALEPFSAEDLLFSGIDFLNATSADLPNILDDSYIDNGDGTYLHKVVGEGYNAIFAADESLKDQCIDTLTIVGDNLEGPRNVRIGDSLIDNQTRFRYDETDFDYDTMSQMLYGTRNTAPYGIAQYQTDGSAALTYATPAEDGMTVLLQLEYSSDGMILKTITVKIK